MDRPVAWAIFIASTLLFIGCIVLLILQRIAIRRELRNEEAQEDSEQLGMQIDSSVFDSPKETAPKISSAGVAPSGTVVIQERYQKQVKEYTFDAGTDISMGRSQSMELVLDDPSVSGRHCVIHFTEKGLLLEDMGSSNGTFLGAAKVVSPVYVKPGDHVMVGVTDLLIKSVQL